MPDMIIGLSVIIINSVVVNAVLDVVANGMLVVLLSLLLVLVLTVSVNSILLLVKNSILSKAMVRSRVNMSSFKYPEAYTGIELIFSSNFQLQA